MSEELKPCPFCNDEMKLDPGAASFATGPGLVYVSCDCGAMGAGGKTRAEAIEVWNRRAPPAVTAKPDLASANRQAAIGAAVAMATKWDSMPDAKPGVVLAAPVEQASAEREQRRQRFETAYAQLNRCTPGGGWNDRSAESDHYEEVDVQDAWILWSTAVAIPPQQSPDPIYLIRPKAGGTTWTECISEQSYDAAMRLGVYESRMVVEVGGQEKAS